MKLLPSCKSVHPLQRSYLQYSLNDIVIYCGRECRPSGVPLTKSYFHGVCETPLRGDTVGDAINDAYRRDPGRLVLRAPEFNQQLTVAELKNKVCSAYISLVWFPFLFLHKHRYKILFPLDLLPSLKSELSKLC